MTEPLTPEGRALLGSGGFDGHFGGCPGFRGVGDCNCGSRLRAIEDAARNVTAQPDLAAARVQCEYGHWAWPGRCEHGHILRSPVPAEGLDVERLARLIVSYADLTHEVLVQGRDWREIAAEWRKVVDECRVYLAALSPEPQPETPDAE